MNVVEQEEAIVKKFGQAMIDKIKIRHGRYQPLGWKTLDLKRVMALLISELEELGEAYECKDYELVSKEAIDVANYACFINELAKDLCKKTNTVV